MKDKKSEKKSAQLDFKDISSSPFFIIGLLVFVCAFIVAGIVFLITDVNSTKKEIVNQRVLYQTNERNKDLIDTYREQSKKAEAQLSEIEDILPTGLGDYYKLGENVKKKCNQFGLDVVYLQQEQVTRETSEVVFTVTVQGSLQQIYDFMNYYSNLEQIHRFDDLLLTKTETGEYNAVISFAMLSEQGATGVAQSVADAA